MSWTFDLVPNCADVWRTKGFLHALMALDPEPGPAQRLTP